MSKTASYTGPPITPGSFTNANVTVNQHGVITNISNGGGAGGNTIITEDEGVVLSNAVTTLNFVGAGVTASGAGATTTVTIPGAGPSTITTQDEGTTLSSAVTTLNFVGAGVTASGAGATTTVTIPTVTAVAVAGDVSNTTSAVSVDKIKGVSYSAQYNPYFANGVAPFSSIQQFRYIDYHWANSYNYSHEGIFFFQGFVATPALYFRTVPPSDFTDFYAATWKMTITGQQLGTNGSFYRRISAGILASNGTVDGYDLIPIYNTTGNGVVADYPFVPGDGSFQWRITQSAGGPLQMMYHFKIEIQWASNSFPAPPNPPP